MMGTACGDWRRRAASGAWTRRCETPAFRIGPIGTGSASEIVVRPVQPIFTRWAEHVDHPRFLERLGGMWDIGWEVDHIAGPEIVRLGAIVPDREPKVPLDDVCDLLMDVRVLRH